MDIKVKALYTLIGLANKAKNLHEYCLANLTFGILLANGVCRDKELRLTYEDADNELSAYYDIVSIKMSKFFNSTNTSADGRCLCIPAPLLTKDALAECLKWSDSRIDRVEHNRQFKDPVDWRSSFNVIASRYLKILRAYFDVETTIENAREVLDIPDDQKGAFDQLCSEFLNNSLCQSCEGSTEPNTVEAE